MNCPNSYKHFGSYVENKLSGVKNELNSDERPVQKVKNKRQLLFRQDMFTPEYNDPI